MIFCSHCLTFDLYRLTFTFHNWTARQAHSQWRSQPDNLVILCKFFCVCRPYKESISREMNNGNDLNLHSMTKLSGWLRCCSQRFTANVERQLQRQAMDAPNGFPSLITFRWSYKESSCSMLDSYNKSYGLNISRFMILILLQRNLLRLAVWRTRQS